MDAMPQVAHRGRHPQHSRSPAEEKPRLDEQAGRLIAPSLSPHPQRDQAAVSVANGAQPVALGAQLSLQRLDQRHGERKIARGAQHRAL